MKEEKKPRLQEVSEPTASPELEQDCAFCGLFCQSRPPGGPSESSSPHFMTEREMNALAAMRRLKAEASEVKRRLRQPENTDDRKALCERLTDLRAAWRRIDRERMEAAEERMRLLGHIQ